MPNPVRDKKACEEEEKKNKSEIIRKLSFFGLLLLAWQRRGGAVAELMFLLDFQPPPKQIQIHFDVLPSPLVAQSAWGREFMSVCCVLYAVLSLFFHTNMRVCVNEVARSAFVSCYMPSMQHSPTNNFESIACERSQTNEFFPVGQSYRPNTVRRPSFLRIWHSIIMIIGLFVPSWHDAIWYYTILCSFGYIRK